jgi:GNAT superfamily N-acetyltransferase
MVQPIEYLQRNLDSISLTKGPHLLPSAFRISGRTFIVGYEKLNEAPPIKGRWLVEVLLGEVRKDVIGGMTLYVYPDERTVHIDYAYVEDRGLGIGSEMVKVVEKDLKSRGYQMVKLLSMKDVIPFWKIIGYRPVGIPDFEGGQHMEKSL